jgi:uncharacterized membrane protein YfcA
MHLTPEQWIFGAVAAFLIGCSKTGVPGVGILAIPLLAQAFGGRASVGIMTPMLLFGDCFAVAWYRQHAQWDKLRALLPWVLVGMTAGAALLWRLGEAKGGKDALNVLIGALVLAMLAVHLARARWNERFTLTSPGAVAATGGIAGFATTVSNAAGPVLGIYMTGLRLPKTQFMGTTAWYYFLFNSLKLPIYVTLTFLNPGRPILTVQSARFDLAMFPVILLGVFLGRWLLPRVPQKRFDDLVLILAALAAAKLILG